MYTFPDETLCKIKDLRDNERVYVVGFEPKVIFKFKRMGDDMVVFYYPDDEKTKVNMCVKFEDGSICIAPPVTCVNKLESMKWPWKWPWGRPISKIAVQISAH